MRTRFDLEILSMYDELHKTIRQECLGRLDRALMIALTRVILDRDGWFEVESQTIEDKTYRVTNNDCTCRDTRAPIVDGRKQCKHRLAAELVLTARAMTQVWDEEVVNTEPNPLPKDLRHISVFHDNIGGPAVHISKTSRSTWYGGLTEASVTRLSNIVLAGQEHPHWYCRPHTLGMVGYVLERNNN